MYGGWAQIAFASDLEEVSPATLRDAPLLVVRRNGTVEVFDAICPHRGAHLGYGGRLAGDAVVCPFHGRHVRLGSGGPDPYCVRQYPALDIGGAIYVLPEERHENGFSSFMRSIADTHYLIPGLTLTARVEPEYVIENVFDADHFHTVHGIDRRPTLTCRRGDGGELIVEGCFQTARPNEWQEGVESGAEGVETHFCARVFSPTVVAAELGTPELPNVIVTAATPAPGGECVIRVLVAIVRNESAPPTVRAIGSLMNGTRTAFEQDKVIWEHLDPTAPRHFDSTDELVLTFREFCRRFAP